MAGLVVGGLLGDEDGSASPARAAEIEAKPSAVDEIALTSTASADVTARVAEHLRLQHRRYRTFLPPRTKPVAMVSTGSGGPAAMLRVSLSGTLADYRAALGARGLTVENPACYVPNERLILLGYDGAKFDGALAAARENAAKLKQAKEDEARRFADTQNADDDRFRRENVAEADRKELKRRRWSVFRQAQAEAGRRHKAAEDKNEKLLADATERLLVLASHELFHAYIDGEVYPRSAAALPPWLDEGLAQFVEHAAWRNDGPVVDSSSTALKDRLKDALKRGEAPTVASILSLEGKHYLVTDPRQTDDVRGRYVFAWALAQLLAETKRLTPRETLDRYVDDRQSDPATRLAKLTKKSPADFEAEWRAYLARITR